VLVPDSRRLSTAPCGFRTKWPSRRSTPLYNIDICLSVPFNCCCKLCSSDAGISVKQTRSSRTIGSGDDVDDDDFSCLLTTVDEEKGPSKKGYSYIDLFLININNILFFNITWYELTEIGLIFRLILLICLGELVLNLTWRWFWIWNVVIRCLIRCFQCIPMKLKITRFRYWL